MKSSFVIVDGLAKRDTANLADTENQQATRRAASAERLLRKLTILIAKKTTSGRKTPMIGIITIKFQWVSVARPPEAENGFIQKVFKELQSNPG